MSPIDENVILGFFYKENPPMPNIPHFRTIVVTICFILKNSAK